MLLLLLVVNNIDVDLMVFRESDDVLHRMMDDSTGEQSKTLVGHSGPVYGVDWLAGGGLLSAGEDCSVRYWDRNSGAGLAVYRGHQFPVWRVVSDLLGSKFVTCSLDRTVRLWSTEYSHPLRIYRWVPGDKICLV